MDPDFEGVNLIRILNWAEIHLPWLKYGTGANGQTNNLVLGAVGGSYGGMYQYVIQNIDPKQRLDALSAQISPNDLTYSLFPNGVIKTEWDLALFGLGNTAGSQGGTFANFDPFVLQFFQDGFSTNSVNKAGREFFYYHSNAYFCNGTPVSSNGGAGTKPAYAPTASPKVNVMLFQGMRDTLFNYTEAVRNYRCFKSKGGDVRLLGYQSGHNTIFAPTIDDPGLAFQPGGPSAILNSNCGNVNVNEATVKFFNLHLKGIANADAGLPRNVCLSLAAGDAVLLDDVPDANRNDASGRTLISKGFNGLSIPVVPNTTPLSGGPFVVEMGYTAPAGGAIMGGIGRLVVKLSNPQGGSGDPILFFGVGHKRASNPLVWDLIDNQILPVRGVGSFIYELVGVAERLGPGDQLALLIYGGHRQYLVNGSLSVPNPFIGLVQVDGSVTLPILGNLPNIAATP
jgi:ABC-2 type transport system ATP-binding protein